MPESAKLPPLGVHYISVYSLVLQTEAFAKLKKKAEADKSISQLEELAAKNPAGARAQLVVHCSKGKLLAMSDPKAAAEEFAKADSEDPYCHGFLRMQALTAAGDKAGAEALKRSFIAQPMRDPWHVLLRAKMGTIVAAAKK